MPDKAKLDDPAQSQRFIDMAREVKATGSSNLFDRAFLSVSTRNPENIQNELKPSKEGSASVTAHLGW